MKMLDTVFTLLLGLFSAGSAGYETSDQSAMSMKSLNQ